MLVVVDWEGALLLSGTYEMGLAATSSLEMSAGASTARGDVGEAVGALRKHEVWVLSRLPVKGVLESIAQEFPGVGAV